MKIGQEVILGTMNSYVIYNGKKIYDTTKWWDVQLDFYAACSLMADLIFDQKIKVQGNDMVTVIDSAPTGYATEDRLLAEIAQSSQPHTLQEWVNIFSDNAHYILFAENEPERPKFDLHLKIYEHLEREGFIQTKKTKIFFFIPAVKTEVTDKGWDFVNQRFDQYKELSLESKDEDLMVGLMLGSRLVNVLQPSMDQAYEAMNQRLDQASQDDPNRLPFVLLQKFLQAWEAGKKVETKTN